MRQVANNDYRCRPEKLINSRRLKLISIFPLMNYVPANSRSSLRGGHLVKRGLLISLSIKTNPVSTARDARYESVSSAYR